MPTDRKETTEKPQSIPVNGLSGDLCLLSIENIGTASKIPVLLPGMEADENYSIPYPESTQSGRNYRKSENAIVHLVIDSIEAKDWLKHGFIDKALAKELDGQKFNTSATGFFITPDGYLVTNSHVACLDAPMSAQWPDGRKEPLRKVYCDPRIDLAILKLDTESPLSYLPLATGGSQVEDTITTLGYPYQWKKLHCSPGNLLGIGKRNEYLKRGDNTVRKVSGCLEVLKTSCQTAPGGSGSPALNAKGEVVGITFAGPPPDDVLPSERYSYAIQVKELRKLVRKIPDLRDRFAH